MAVRWHSADHRRSHSFQLLHRLIILEFAAVATGCFGSGSSPAGHTFRQGCHLQALLALFSALCHRPKVLRRLAFGKAENLDTHPMRPSPYSSLRFQIGRGLSSRWLLLLVVAFRRTLGCCTGAGVIYCRVGDFGFPAKTMAAG